MNRKNFDFTRRHLYWRGVTSRLVTMALLITAKFSAFAQGTTYYQLEPGSAFTPLGGNTVALSGTFEIFHTTFKFPVGGQEYEGIREKFENLRWSADSWQFESDKPSDSFSVTRFLLPAGGTTGGTKEYIIDSTIQVTLPEFQLAQIRLDSPIGGDSVGLSPFQLVWPGLHRLELLDSASNLIGVMSISTVVVPEPSAMALIGIALVSSVLFLRRAHRLPLQTPFPRLER